jgi:hypothetical protein
MLNSKKDKSSLGKTTPMTLYLSQRAFDLINLLTLSSGVSRTQLIRDCIDSSLLPSEKRIESIIQMIASKIVQTFIYGKSAITYANFRIKQRQYLKKCKLSTFLINAILQEVTKQYAAHKKSIGSGRNSK